MTDWLTYWQACPFLTWESDLPSITYSHSIQRKMPPLLLVDLLRKVWPALALHWQMSEKLVSRGTRFYSGATRCREPVNLTFIWPRAHAKMSKAITFYRDCGRLFPATFIENTTLPGLNRALRVPVQGVTQDSFSWHMFRGIHQYEGFMNWASISSSFMNQIS
jgi:hypothetical protein